MSSQTNDITSIVFVWTGDILDTNTDWEGGEYVYFCMQLHSNRDTGRVCVYVYKRCLYTHLNVKTKMFIK